ncbi:MAG: histidine phosphatase family protein [Actinomycetota bacterium]|nr:histidine phosphatase family protein [Actinomycetota bacterium]
MARHGQTAWNVDGRFQGQADPPLDAMGRAQAARLGTELAALRPNVLVSSDLLRARQTAMALSRVCGVEMAVDTHLREVDLGGWEGLDQQQAAERFPDEYRRWSEGDDPRRGGGETEGEAGVRVAAAIRSIIGDATDGATVVIVAHGLVIRRAMGLLGEGGTIGLAGPPPHLGNGQWMIFEVAAGDRQVT